MVPSAQNLIWLDMEMTGLKPWSDKILELAVVVTDEGLNVVAEGPVLVVHQADAVLNAMDDWNTQHHSQSGLIERVKASRLSEAEAEEQMLDFLMQYVPPGKSPMCGNSICQDRRFLAHCMPHLERYFHYRNLDVSSLKILVHRWAPDILPKTKKVSKHEALSDVYDSIQELAFYRDHFLKLPSAADATDG